MTDEIRHVLGTSTITSSFTVGFNSIPQEIKDLIREKKVQVGEHKPRLAFNRKIFMFFDSLSKPVSVKFSIS